jgi:hypothetical protein
MIGPSLFHHACLITDQQRVFWNSVMPKRASLSRLSDALESA